MSTDTADPQDVRTIPHPYAEPPQRVWILTNANRDTGSTEPHQQKRPAWHAEREARMRNRQQHGRRHKP